LKEELFALNISKVTGSSATSLLNIKQLRKGIARVLTVMNQKTKAEVRKFYENKKFKPLDCRVKETRAARRKLKPRHMAAKLLKTVKKERAFPQRKFALRA
jgi:large subunit ribosomal protein L35e